MCLTLASLWQHLAMSFVLRVPQEKELRVIAHVTLHCSACTFRFPVACPNHLAPLRPMALGSFFAHRAEAVERPACKSASGHDPEIVPTAWRLSARWPWVVFSLTAPRRSNDQPEKVPGDTTPELH